MQSVPIPSTPASNPSPPLDADLEARKAFIGFGPDDERLLARYAAASSTRREPFLEQLQRHLLSFEPVRRLFEPDGAAHRLRALGHYDSLFSGDYGPAFAQERRRVGEDHQRQRVEPRWYLGASATYLRFLLTDVWESEGADLPLVAALIKLFYLDAGLTLDAYWEAEARRSTAAGLQASAAMAGREQAEDALRRSEESFRGLIEEIPEAVVVHRGGRFVYVNPRAAKLFGVAGPSALVGTNVLDVVHPDDRQLVASRLQTARSSPPVEERFVRADGGVVTAEVTSFAIPFDGQLSHVAVARDVTNRRDMTARMMQLDRAIAIGTLAAGVAHEINNPLAFVMANLQYVAETFESFSSKALASAPPELAAKIGELVEVIGEARGGAERIRAIVRDLKTFSPSEHDRRTLLDPRRVVEAAVNLSWNEIKHRAQLVKELSPAPPVEANEAQLGQVLVNLLVNAAQAIVEGAAEKNRITVATQTDPDGRAVVEVRDTGSGIPPETLGRIFDPFFTTKPVGQGTGLGLSVCQQIVRSLGGEITVQSKLGVGTTFRILLPPAAQAAPVPPTAAPAAAAPPAKPRILIVDDEPLVGKALARLLGASREVVSVTRAADALERLGRGEQFDLVFCDLMMPEIGGPDLYVRIRARSPALAERMVFMTGGAFTPAAQDFLAQVPNRRLDKPVDRESLDAVVKEMLGR